MPSPLLHILLSALFAYLLATMPHTVSPAIRWLTVGSTLALLGVLIGTILPMTPATVVDSPVTIVTAFVVGAIAAAGNIAGRYKSRT